MSVNSKMTAIADKIRTLLGLSGKMGLDAMANNLGIAVNECDSQAALIAQIKTALVGKVAGGGAVPVVEPLEVTENGTYTAPNGVDGYSPVIVNVAGGDGDLPAGYSRCDFIQFDGTQLIDTGIIGNQDTKIRARFTWGSDKQNHLFGCASSDNDKSITSYMNGSWRFGNKAASKTIQKNSNDLPYSVLLDKTTIGVTGNRTSISDVPEFQTVATLLLGGARTADGGLPGSGIIGRVFDFRIWDGDTIVQEMIPVTDGTVYRFWDAVSRSFFDPIDGNPLEGGNV